MAWVTPSTKTQGTLITPSIWNQDIVANTQFLYDNLGIPQAKLGYTKLGSAGSFSFPSLSGDYDALIIRALIQADGNNQTRIRFNNDTGNNYGSYRLSIRFVAGTDTSSGESVGTSGIFLDASESTPFPWVYLEMNLPNWSSGNEKILTAYGGWATNISNSNRYRVTMGSGFWTGTDPISRIDMAPASGSYAAGSWMGIYAAQHL